ncbi:AAA-like domain-containing protein [Armatimonas sp.]|uniref:AAA-like domain-containing protein n=1 Tax=Armatimonas sp. TaxID=1872638 RepID=UPI00374D00FB
MSEPVAFYVTGGTLPPDSASYIERAADTELLSALQRSELCYILNARQMGKSSLSVKTRQALEAAGTRTAFLDLQKFGSSASAEQWYRALLERIGSDLKLRPQFLAYWRDNAELPPLTRLFGAIREIALVQIPGKLVIFLDEMDVVRDLGFQTDEFFGAIRESHNARAEDAAFERLTFCIIGTVAPTDLIRDVRLSPFNIGTRIKLADFTPIEASPLATPLPGGNKTLERVLWWTSGHPYLTQRLCAELTRAGSTNVDAMVTRLFLAKSDADVDENIKNVRNSVLRLRGEFGYDHVDLLTRYGKIVAGKRVVDKDSDMVCAALRLSGLIGSHRGQLQVRNRVYAKLFDHAWIRRHLPDAEVRRQRTAVARARWQIGSIAASIVMIMGGLTGFALQSRDEALFSARAEKTARDEAKRERRNAVAAAHTEKLARIEAQRQTQKALRARNEAQLQARRADQQTLLARTNALVANHLTFIAKTQVVQNAIARKDYLLAQQSLEDMQPLLTRVSPHEVNWIWSYLQARIHPERLELKGHTQPVDTVAFSPGRKVVATGSRDKTARLWDTSTGRCLQTLRGHTQQIASVAFSPDGKMVATGSWDTTARLWDVSTGREQFRLKGHRAEISSVAFSPDGKQLATGSWDKTVQLWNTATGQRSRVLKGHSSAISAVAFSPDGKELVSGSEDTTARLWDVVTGQEGRSFKGHTSVLSVGFSPDGKRLVTSGDDEVVRFWDVVTGQESLTLKGNTQAVYAVCFSPDGTRVLTGNDDYSARLWDASTGRELRQLWGHTDGISSICFSPDGNSLLTGSFDGTARLWDTAVDRETLTLKAHREALYTVCFSPNGKLILTGSGDGDALLWDAVTGKVKHTLGARGAVISACFSPDGTRMMTSNFMGYVQVWDTLTAKVLFAFRAHSKGRMAAAFSPDGKRILTGGSDKLVRLWDERGQERLRLHGHTDLIRSVAFSPDGKRLLTGSQDATVRLWDASTGRELRQFTGFGWGFHSVAFSPDGKRVVAGSWESTVRVWDVETGRVCLTLRGHHGSVHAAVFSPEGRRILTGGQDTTVRLWDVATGRELLTLQGHTGVIRSVAFSSDGQLILTGSEDKTARVWHRMTDTQVSAVEQSDYSKN